MGARVMIFEDNLIASLALESMLKEHGYESLGRFDSADTLVELCDENPPDIVLLDIMLNGDKNGIEAAEELRAKSDVPILFLSALNNAVTLNKINEIANAAISVKPYFERVITSKMEELLKTQS